ncbi:MAG: MASE3 domain-containing protein [Desulfitobacteriaceae bacterium]
MINTRFRDLVLNRPFKILLAQAGAMLFASVFLASILQVSWASQPNLLHTSAELICIAIAFFTFVISWLTYDTDPIVNHIIGFGFLIVGLLDILHTYFFPTLNQFPLGYSDLSIWYWVLSRLTESVVLALSVFRVSRPKLNKYFALLLTLSIAVSVSFSISIKPNFLPVLLTNEGPTVTKISLEYVVIAIFFLTLYQLRRQMNHRDLLTYRYIFLALLMAIPSEFIFTVYNNITDYYSTLGHLLKIASYYFLFRGVWVSAVTHPQKIMKDILNELPQGLFLYNSFDKVSFANKQAEELMGCTLEEIQGLHADQMATLLYTDDTKSLVRRLRDSNSVQEQIIFVNNARSQKKLLINGRKLEDGSSLLLFRDAKKLQELENMQLQTRTILHSIQTPMYLADKNGSIIMCNKGFANLTELTENEIVGLKDMDLEELLQLRRESEFLVDIAFENQAIPVNTTTNTDGYLASVVTKSGDRKDLLIHRTFIQNVDSEPIGKLIISTDITAMNEQRRKVQQREKLAVLGEMAAGIVHEIRNPLTTIRGFSQILLAKTDNEKLREYAGLIVSTSDEVNKVVSDFLTFAKPRPPLFREVSVSSVINSLKNMLDAHSYLKGADLNIVPILEEKPIQADEDQLKQVCINVAKNAIEAMQEIVEPKLIISAEYDEPHNEMIIKISDNGKGMSSEQISKAGTPFYTTKDTGTGLGLGICYQIVKEHQGRVEIKSKEGLGTTFIIALPCIER